MAIQNQVGVSHKELVEMMIKHADIHEGKWMLSLNVVFNTGNFGPTEEHANPGAMVTINQIMIQRELPGQPTPEAWFVDAAIVNPVSPPITSKKRK